MKKIFKAILMFSLGYLLSAIVNKMIRSCEDLKKDDVEYVDPLIEKCWIDDHMDY